MRKLGSIIDNLKSGQEAPTRHYNPYLIEALSLENYLYTAKELASKKETLFENKNHKLIIEIGCYMGKNVLEMAMHNPEINVVGLDITYKRGVKAARKIAQNKITNAKIALCDGQHFLEHFIQKNSVTGVCVFFPDPWPKDRHEKNRLLNESFIYLLKEKLEPKGFFWFKTDAFHYFQQTEVLLFNSGFTLQENPQNQDNDQPTNLNGGPYETAFQKIFTTKKVQFYQGIYIKN